MTVKQQKHFDVKRRILMSKDPTLIFKIALHLLIFKIIQLQNLCLFLWSFPTHSRIFHTFGDVTIAGEGLQMLTYARHL